MFEIPEAVGTDLLAFGLLSLSLVLFGSLRLARPLDPGYRTGFRVGLWLAVWQGTALVLRMSGFV